MKIFISYRRKSWSFVHLLEEKLREQIEGEIFVDYTSIDDTDFERSILSHLSRSDVVLVIITELTFAPERINSSDDWLRREIALALKLQKPIVLLCVDNISLPPSSRLPDDIQDIVKRQAIAFYPEYFEPAVQRLVTFMKKVLVAASSEKEMPPSPAAVNVALQPSSHAQQSAFLPIEPDDQNQIVSEPEPIQLSSHSSIAGQRAQEAGPTIIPSERNQEELQLLRVSQPSKEIDAFITLNMLSLIFYSINIIVLILSLLTNQNQIMPVFIVLLINADAIMFVIAILKMRKQHIISWNNIFMLSWIMSFVCFAISSGVIVKTTSPAYITSGVLGFIYVYICLVAGAVMLFKFARAKRQALSKLRKHK